LHDNVIDFIRRTSEGSAKIGAPLAAGWTTMRNGHSVVLASILLCASTLALQACVSSRECTSEECLNDAKITDAIKSKLKEHRELGGPNVVYVQTRGGVVYLTGQVATDLQRQSAESIARQVPGVGEVVNSIAISFEGR
jgi:hypothetical protein